MKNTNTIIIVILLIIIIGGYTYFKNKNVSTVAPQTTDNSQTSPSNNSTPDNKPIVDTNVNANISTNVKAFTVTGQNYSFTPNKISVKKGDTVKITFKNSNGFHDFRIDEFNVATSKIAGGTEETVTFVADKTGSFVYYCSVGTHRAQGMWGTLTVI